MKKLIFLFSLLTVMLSVNAQENAVYDYKLDYSGTWLTYNMPTASYATTATDSIWYYTTLKESDTGLKYDIKLKLDSISGTVRRTVITLKAKKWESDAYSTITTVPWTGGRDTTVLFTQTSTAQYYRYFQIYIKSDLKGFVFKVPELSKKFWK